MAVEMEMEMATATSQFANRSEHSETELDAYTLKLIFSASEMSITETATSSNVSDCDSGTKSGNPIILYGTQVVTAYIIPLIAILKIKIGARPCYLK
ncbi:uncharacterized protein LOC143922916 isoform X2 [Arctopsyche grandis]|uniref:uncharacterized protein LOC143922916 isoform X2 n=1 Tax=Arctopsyche grandis TaxID=121162 RepID=UPI00406D7B1E